MLKYFLIFIFITLSFSSFSETYWRIKNENGEELLLVIQINAENKTFEAHTRKEALREMAGTLTFMLAKTSGKLAYPEIVHSEGVVSFNSDTTYYDGSFNYLDKSFPLKAKSWDNRFIGTLTDNRNRPHNLTGERIESDKQLEDYSSLILRAFSLTEQLYWDRNLKNSQEWIAFKSKVNDCKSKISDDYELGAILYWHSRKTTFAPFEIKRVFKKENESNPERPYVIRTFNANTAYIDLSNLPIEKKDMDQLFREIQKKEYTTLILDARGRKNLLLQTATLLAGHLIIRPSDWGIYITRRWLDNNGTIPVTAAYSKVFKDAGLLPLNFQQIWMDNGYFMKPMPAQSVFTGNLYVLIDQRTSRVAEALAIWLKNDKVALLAGRKSAGQPMLLETFSISDQFHITLPVAQFYDTTGKSRFGVGVEPDIATDDDALNAVLKLQK